MNTPPEIQRLALLIGVSDYRPDSIIDIPVISTDIGLMTQSLQESSYAVSTLTGTGNDEPTRGQIRESVRRVLLDAAPDATVLIYFTGHGLRVGGADYLCPSDMPSSMESGVEDDLVPADLGALARGAIDSTAATTVVFMIDACRDIARTKSIQLEAPGPSSERTMKRVHTLFSCNAGETAGFDKEQGSIFTIAASEALRPDSEPRTIAEVFDYVQSRMIALRKKAALPAQQASTLAEFSTANKTST